MASGGGGNDTLFGSDVEFASSDVKGDDGDDALHAGTSGANLDGGAGADRLFSGAGSDQLSGGRDENGLLDGAQDLFVYGPGDWGNDILFFAFEDGVDKFDLRGSGLTFEDLVLTNTQFQSLIESSKGTIEIAIASNEPVVITEADFLFA